MNDTVYLKLAWFLDALPIGFPKTKSSIEIRLLKKIFTPDEADLFCDLKLHLETAAQIKERTFRPIQGLEEQLITMWSKGKIWAQEINGVKYFKMIPFVIGIYEFQLNRQDPEFFYLFEQYRVHLMKHLNGFRPSLMQVIPVEENIFPQQKAHPYQQLSRIIENGKSFRANECICKKGKRLIGDPCQKKLEVCFAISEGETVLENHPLGGWVLSKDEVLALMKKAEDAGLIHLSINVQKGQWCICNCCEHCCPMLQAVKTGNANVVNSQYRAQIDPDRCNRCGNCIENLCQLKAITKRKKICSVLAERCIGCGLCISTCPTEAIRLVRKPQNELMHPPVDEMAWFEERSRNRGVDINLFK